MRGATSDDRTRASGTDEPPVSGSVLQRDIVVVGASAGGVEALRELVERLPPELPAAVFILLHVSPGGTSVLPQILARRTPCPLPPPPTESQSSGAACT